MFPHLYLHVPFCDGKCRYCGFYSVLADPSAVSHYPDLPAREWELTPAALASDGGEGPETVYLGGGTPGLLGRDGLRRLKDALAPRLPLDAVKEWTAELNPASVSRETLATLKAIGVNRLSLGVQSFSDATLARMGRRHSAADARQALRLAADAGFANIGIDLIAGFPSVANDEWLATLDTAASLGLKHLSVYALSVEPETALAQQIARGAAPPDDDAQLDQLGLAEERLARAGFLRYEISNYALPGFECQHNLGVWRGNDYLGLGPSAASRIGRRRWTNAADLAAYAAALEAGREPPRTCETLDADEDAAERALFALRLHEGLDPADFARRAPAFGRPRAEAWSRRLEALSRQGLTERCAARWRLTARGREVCDAVLRELA